MQPFIEADEKKKMQETYPQLPLAQSRIEHASLVLQATKKQGIAEMQKMAEFLKREHDQAGLANSPLSNGSSAAESLAAMQNRMNKYSNYVYFLLLALAFVYFYYWKGTWK